jgi:hypothetical protein
MIYKAVTLEIERFCKIPQGELYALTFTSESNFS